MAQDEVRLWDLVNLKFHRRSNIFIAQLPSAENTPSYLRVRRFISQSEVGYRTSWFFVVFSVPSGKFCENSGKYLKFVHDTFITHARSHYKPALYEVIYLKCN